MVREESNKSLLWIDRSEVPRLDNTSSWCSLSELFVWIVGHLSFSLSLAYLVFFIFYVFFSNFSFLFFFSFFVFWALVSFHCINEMLCFVLEKQKTNKQKQNKGWTKPIVMLGEQRVNIERNVRNICLSG